MGVVWSNFIEDYRQRHDILPNLYRYLSMKLSEIEFFTQLHEMKMNNCIDMR